jgi:hypothetical protein
MGDTVGGALVKILVGGIIAVAMILTLPMYELVALFVIIFLIPATFLWACTLGLEGTFQLFDRIDWHGWGEDLRDRVDTWRGRFEDDNASAAASA